jgi:mono/diheme cytochrome c family protein
VSSFKEDRLENEKHDPTEGSNLKFVNVPLTLLAVFFGFGVTYLTLRTDHVTMKEGDSRTHATAATGSAPADGGALDTTALLEKGKQIYTTTCQACHQATGEGLPGAFPPLAGSEWVTGPSKRTVAIVLHGVSGEITVKGDKFNSVMPTFKDQFKSEEIAAVVSYVRQTYGKTSDVVTPELVDQVRNETKAQAAPWAGEADLNAKKWD